MPTSAYGRLPRIVLRMAPPPVNNVPRDQQRRKSYPTNRLISPNLIKIVRTQYYPIETPYTEFDYTWEQNLEDIN